MNQPVNRQVGPTASPPANLPGVPDIWYDTTNDLWKRWNGTYWVITGSGRFPKSDNVRALPRLEDVFPEPMASPPTLSLSGPGTTSPIGSPLNPSTNGLGYDSSHVSFRNGAAFTAFSQNSVTYYQNTANAGDSTPPSSVEFEFYGDTFAVEFRNPISAASTLWVWIDGVPATAAPVAQSAATTTGQPYWLQVTFATTGPRRVRIWFASCDFGGISYASGCFASPIVTSEKKMAVYGDSWIGGALSVPFQQLHGVLLPQLLGMEGILAGQGSTGLTTAGTGSPKAAYTDTTRLGKITTAAADYIYMHCSQNDDSASTSTYTSALQTILTNFQTNAPNAKVILMVPPRINASLPSQRSANIAATISVAATYSNVAGVIDNTTDSIYGPNGAALSTGSTSWLTGTGKSGSPASDGTNADVYVGSDAAHLTIAGHRYWSMKVAHAVRQILAVA